jgi:cytidine deaminase
MADQRKELLAAARSAREKAYAPYSLFHVGAAVLGADGRIYSGCNVENASLGLSCCAERNAIFAMVAAGEREIREILVIGETAEPLAPCGACRQVMAEFAKPSVVVHMCDRSGAGRSTTVAELAPFIFRLKKRTPARARSRKPPIGK